MMNKFYVLFISVFTMFLVGCAEENAIVSQTQEDAAMHHVPLQKAKKRLLQIAAQLNSENSTRSSAIAGIDNSITSVTVLGKDKRPMTRGQETEAAYYVFRFGQDEGFAIMGADDRLPELMAIASGTPNQDNPTEELPDTSFWKLPDLNYVADSVPAQPLPDVNAPDRPYTMLLQNNQIPVHWGQRSPYNNLLESTRTDTVELRPSTSCVAIAQLLTRDKFRSTLYLDYFLRSGVYHDTVFMNELCKFSDFRKFEKRPDMALNVAKLFRYLQSERGLNLDFFGAKMDSINNVVYVEGIVPYATSSSFYDSNDLMGRALDRLGLNEELHETPKPFTQFDRDGLISSFNRRLKSGWSILVGGYAYWEEVYLIHNAMYFDDMPNQIYFLVNKCRERNGDGYYLATGLHPDHYYLINK